MCALKSQVHTSISRLLKTAGKARRWLSESFLPSAEWIGERLIVYKDSTKMVEQPITAYEDLVKIVSDPGCKIVFEVRSISSAQSKLIDLIAKAVDAPTLKHGETRSLGAAFEAVFAWWDGLAEVSKVISLYEKERQTRLTQLKNLLSAVGKSADRFDLFRSSQPIA